MNEEQKAQNQAAVAKVIQNPEQQAIIDLKAKFAADRDALNIKYTEQATLIYNQIHMLQRQFDELGQAIAQKFAAMDKDEAEQLVALRAKLL
jgi:carbonic anhydrase